VERRIKDKGFSLLEVIVALTIILILVLPIAQVLSSQKRREASLKEKQTALEVARSGMEEFLASRENSLGLKDDSSNVEASGMKWKVVWVVIDAKKDDEPAAGTDLHEVRVKVRLKGKPDILAELIGLANTRGK
jgi:prepilin-type N-terminal cleavage/methylation domain-containing protein